MPRGSRRTTKVDTSLINVSATECYTEYIRQYNYLRRNPCAKSIPPRKTKNWKETETTDTQGRTLGALGYHTKVDTTLITVFERDCRKEYVRQYNYLSRKPDCLRAPPPSKRLIKREIKKLREMIHPYDAPNFERTTKQEFHQARKKLKTMIHYLS